MDVIRQICDSVRTVLVLLWVLAFTVTLSHFIVMLLAYQFTTVLWGNCVILDQWEEWYYPISCLGVLTIPGVGELIFLVYTLAFWAYCWYDHTRTQFTSVADIVEPEPEPQTVVFSPDEPGQLRQQAQRRAAAFLSTGVIPESAVPGSNFIMMAPAPWQASIWYFQNGTRTLAGHANRVAGHLLVNFHVLQTFNPAQLALLVLRAGKEAVVVPLSSFKFKSLVEDVVAANIADAKKPIPGLKDAPVKHVQGYQPAYIATDYPQKNASTAGLRNHPESWGMVVYEGSTRSGFSGAGYCHGSGFYGMHCYGGIQNVGYAASYLAMKLKSNESSDYIALSNMLDNSSDRDFASRRVNPDEYEVRYQGRYFIIEAEEFLQLEEDYGDEEAVGRRRRGRRNDRWGESGITRLFASPEVEPFDPSAPIEPETPSAPAPAQPPQGSAIQAPPAPPPAPIGPVVPEHGIHLPDQICKCDALERRLEDLALLVEQERRDRVLVEAQLRQKIKWSATTLWSVQTKINRVLAEIGPASSDDDPEEIYPDVDFSPTHPPPDPSVLPEAGEHPSGNLRSPARLGGAISEGLDRIASRLRKRNQDRSTISQKTSTTNGPQTIPLVLEEVLKSIQSSLAELTNQSLNRRQQRDSSSERGSASETEPSTKVGPKQYPKRKSSGYKQRANSTGAAAQASAPSPPTQPSRTHSAGTASTSRTQPTGSTSNKPRQPASASSKKAGAVVIK